MTDTEEEKRILQEFEPVLQAMGFAIVELKVGRTHRKSHVSLTVYRPEGVGIEDCAAISRNVSPRLELIEDLKNVTLEVSSPGTTRVLKSLREFPIFQGKAIRALIGDVPEWQMARIAGVSGDDVLLEIEGKVQAVPYNTIRKAKLKDTEEARE